VQIQIREKNDKFQQRKLDVMFAAAPAGAAALGAVAADSLAMDMEASTPTPRPRCPNGPAVRSWGKSEIR
jgi:PAB1-binding protein PBP1